MPLYNSENFIKNAIDTVKAQTYKNWELIIIDDNSTDSSASIAEKISNTDKRILFFKNKKNLGGAKTRNIAINKAQGKYIAFLDSDDLWDENKLEIQIDQMIKNNWGFTFSDYRTVTESGEKINSVITPNKTSLQDMYSHNYIACLTVIYDTSFFGKFYMPNVRKRQDYALWLEMLKKFEFAYTIPQELASYRIRKESLSTNKIHAIKFYWQILRKVAGLSLIRSTSYTGKYIFITALKKKNPQLYSKLLIRR